MTPDRIIEIYERHFNDAIRKAEGSPSMQAALMLLKLSCRRDIASETAAEPKKRVAAI